MNCIIIDDEPLARRAIEILVNENPDLHLAGQFPDALSASKFIADNPVELVFLDIRMPGINGIDFARNIPEKTLIIFTTAHTEYALDSYEVDAIDYLVKPVEKIKFNRAVAKALTYRSLLESIDGSESVESMTKDYMYIKSDRRFHKVLLDDILYIEGLKDYVIIHLPEKNLITKKNLKTIHENLPGEIFLRVNKSYIVNTSRIESFDNNDILIGRAEIPIGNSYRDMVFSNLLK